MMSAEFPYGFIARRLPPAFILPVDPLLTGPTQIHIHCAISCVLTNFKQRFQIDALDKRIKV